MSAPFLDLIKEFQVDVSSPEKTVKEDVKVLKESSFFKGTQIVGLVHDTHTGFLKEVVGVE